MQPPIDLGLQKIILKIAAMDAEREAIYTYIITFPIYKHWSIPAHNDLVAVAGPGLVHLLHEDQLVQVLTQKLPCRGRR